ncbi:MAG: transposase, partial [Deltaproteobacteria bacterium]|nr:transposase [Nannocystaceae bacterium]
MPKVEQLELRMPTRGGKRAGAGRKRQSPRARVPHVRRPMMRPEHPVQVTLRACAGLPNLRERGPWVVIVRVLRALRERADFRVIHYSVMSNHLHFVVEADGRDALSSGMIALATRLAISLNRLFERKGPMFDHRFHARALTTPRAVRVSLHYVLSNLRKHAAQGGQHVEPGWIDDRSSGRIFDGWRTSASEPHPRDYGTSPARTWLLRVGWRRH